MLARERLVRDRESVINLMRVRLWTRIAGSDFEECAKMMDQLDLQAIPHPGTSMAKARIMEMNDQIARECAFLENIEDTQGASLQGLRESIQRRIKFYQYEIAYWTESLRRESGICPMIGRAK